MDIKQIGTNLIKILHYLALFIIGITIIWSAVYEYIQIMSSGYAKLKDILLLFLYLEMGAMIGIYFKTNKLPLNFLIFIAITALARHLVIDSQGIKDEFHMYLLLVISIAILILSTAIFVLSKTKEND